MSERPGTDQQHLPELPTKVSTRVAPRTDRKAARRAEIEHQAEERHKVLEYDRVARVRAARLRTRKRLFWWTFPLMLAALLVAVKAFSVPMIANGAKDSYETGNYADSRSSYHRLQIFNVAEQWKVHFAEGTAQLRDNNLEAAVDELFRAHDAAPDAPEDMSDVGSGDVVPVCIIQTNLAVAHELQGDVAQGVADGHVERMKREQEALDALGTDVPTDGTAPDPDAYKDLAISTYLEAEGLYQDANEIRVWNECPDDDEARERNVTKDTTAREKREALENPPPPPEPDPQDPQDPQDPEEPQDPQDPEDPQDPQDPQDPGDPADPGEPLTPEEQRRKDLEERNKQGEKERKDTEGWLNDGDGGGGSQNW